MIEEKAEMLKQFFENIAYGWDNRKRIGLLQKIINSSNRETRDIIWKLKTEKGMVIACDTNGGYFLANKDNLIDMSVAKHYIKSQWSRVNRIREGLKPFDKLFPVGQIEMEYKK